MKKITFNQPLGTKPNPLAAQIGITPAAFTNCTALEEVIFKGLSEAPYVDAAAFTNVTNCKLIYPCDLEGVPSASGTGVPFPANGTGVS